LLASLGDDLKLRAPWLLKELISNLVNEQGSHLTWEPPLHILERVPVLYHIIELLVAFMCQDLNVTGSIALENDPLGEEHLHEMNG
jgi:hypothetical protein